MVKRCFNDCLEGINGKPLSDSEKVCMRMCASRVIETMSVYETAEARFISKFKIKESSQIAKSGTVVTI